MEKLFFSIFAGVSVVSALCVVFFRNPVRSALALIMCLLQVAAIFVLLRSPFLAVVQVFIYVGAVMVLFLFVVMILDIRQAQLETFFPVEKRWLMYVIAPVITLEFLIVIFGRSFEGFVLKGGEETRVETLGKALFTEYLLPFEVISVLLLAAMVGAIVMAKKRWN